MKTTDWTDVEIQNKLKELLKNDPDGLLVEFTKVDGDVRRMICTLNPTMIPQPIVTDSDEPKRIKSKNDDVCIVYDIENEGWRSFRYDSIMVVETKNGEIV